MGLGIGELYDDHDGGGCTGDNDNHEEKYDRDDNDA